MLVLCIVCGLVCGQMAPSPTIFSEWLGSWEIRVKPNSCTLWMELGQSLCFVMQDWSTMLYHALGMFTFVQNSRIASIVLPCMSFAGEGW